MNTPEKNPITLEQTAAAVNKLHAATTNAFSEFGNSMLEMAKQQKEMAEAVNAILKDRKAQLELIGQLTTKLQEVANLQNSDHALLEVLTAANTMLAGKTASC